MPRVEFRCGRGHRHEPSAHYDVGNGTCYCIIGPCNGVFDSDESLIRRVVESWTEYDHADVTTVVGGRKEGT